VSEPPTPDETTGSSGSIARRYHLATNHPTDQAVLNEHYAGSMIEELRPRPYKLYPTLEAIPLPRDFAPSTIPALDAIAEATGTGSESERRPNLADLARLCFFTDGVTKRFRRGERVIDFRAAPCTGALYHVELYLVCGDLPDLPAGVYHYGVHDHALRRLRTGDYRGVIVEATGAEPAVAAAPVVMVTTSVFWRNAWKYTKRAYRHTYWDTGTMLPNTLAVAAANGLSARLVLGFADRPIADLIGVDLEHEGVIGLVALGRAAGAPPPAPPLDPLALPTEPYSPREIDYPLIRETHRATLLATGEQAAAWRAVRVAPDSPAPSGVPLVSLPPPEHIPVPTDPIEDVIRRRGSTRRFARESISLDQLSALLHRTTRGLPSDSLGRSGVPFGVAYLLVNAVAGLQPGVYIYDRDRHRLGLLRPLTEEQARERAYFLSLEQDLGGDAAVNIYFLTDLDPILDRHGDRGYRLAQLGAALVVGKQYLAAYALGLGATGLTFFDDAAAEFFSPHVGGKSVMFLMAIGVPWNLSPAQ
jgi:SagB-type dehydrogenase family enzyme